MSWVVQKRNSGPPSAGGGKWAAASVLKTIFQDELNISGTLRSENLSVVRCAGGVLAAEFLTEVEDRRVGEIGHVDAELDRLAFGKVKILGQADVRCFQTGTIELANAAIAEGSESRSGDRGWIQESESIVRGIEAHWHATGNSGHAIGASGEAAGAGGIAAGKDGLSETGVEDEAGADAPAAGDRVDYIV